MNGVDGWKARWMGGWTARWMDGLEGWLDGWKDVRLDR